ncbi:MAG: helix-turn-helix domain-containing protein [Deltaproteobacteria bacterium]|nr:helix-turn-helix domain-containing protein [Deltaproteobacteria bacterium]
MANGWVQSISRGSQVYFEEVCEFWNEYPSLTDGFQAAIDTFSHVVEDRLVGRSDLVRGSAGSLTSLVSLFGSLPLSFNDWMVKVEEKISKGPGETLYRFLEVPVRGMISSAISVNSSLKSWCEGELASEDSFRIGREVTGLLGSAVLLGEGARLMTAGSVRMVNPPPTLTFAWGRRSVAVARAGVLFQGGGAVLTGATHWMASAGGEGPKGLRRRGGRPFARGEVSDQRLAEVLERNGGNRAKTAQEFGFSGHNVGERVRKAKAGSSLAKFKGPEYLGSASTVANDTQLAQTLERHGGNRSRAARELGLTRRTVSQRVVEAKTGSALERFQRFQRPIKKRSPVVSESRLADLLEKHRGNQSNVAREAGVTPSAISRRVMKAKPGSALERFRKTNPSSR